MPRRVPPPGWAGSVALVLLACSGSAPPSLSELGSDPQTGFSDGGSRALHPLPVACQLRQGGGLLHQGAVVVAGVLLEGGCEDYEVGDDWDPPAPGGGPPPSVLVVRDSTALPEGPWLADSQGPIAFLFPVALGGERWGIAWGEAVSGTAFGPDQVGGDGWPQWVASRMWVSEFSGGGWQTPQLVESAPVSFRTPLVARQVSLARDGSAVLLVEEDTPGMVRASSPKVRLWSARFGSTVIPFASRPFAAGGEPVLAIDNRGHHWLAWLEERQGPGASGRAFMIQDVGPGGRDVREPREVPLALDDGPRIKEMTLVFDALDRPHLLWMHSPVSPRFFHATVRGADERWDFVPVPVPDGASRSGFGVRLIAGSIPEGGLFVHEATSDPMATDGHFGNMNLWRWSEAGWTFVGVDEGPARADLDPLPVLRSRGSAAGAFPTVLWTAVDWPSVTDTVPPQRMLRLR